MNNIDKLQQNLSNYRSVPGRCFLGKAISILSGIAVAGGAFALFHFVPGTWVFPIHMGLKEMIFVSVACGLTVTVGGVIGVSIYERVKKKQISFKKYREVLEEFGGNGSEILRCYAIYQAIYDLNRQSFDSLSKFLVVLSHTYSKSNETSEKEKNALNALLTNPQINELLADLQTTDVKLEETFINKCTSYITTWKQVAAADPKNGKLAQTNERLTKSAILLETLRPPKTEQPV